MDDRLLNQKRAALDTGSRLAHRYLDSISNRPVIPDDGAVDGLAGFPVEAADSWATDAHKWLNAPYNSGLAIVRSETALRRAMAFDAAYFTTDAERPLAHLGLQMSQRARAVETWALLMRLGRFGVAELVDRLTARSQQMAQRLAGGGATILADPALNQTLVALGDDKTTEQTIDRIQSSDVCWAGKTIWQGRVALRISISDAATSVEDVDTAADCMLAAWLRPATQAQN